MFQAKFDEAKYLTLGVGAVNVTFTLVAVSTNITFTVPSQPQQENKSDKKMCFLSLKQEKCEHLLVVVCVSSFS